MGSRLSSVLAFVLLFTGMAVLSWPAIKDVVPLNKSASPAPEPKIDNQTGLAQLAEGEKTIATPPPLRADTSGRAGQLSINGVFIATNVQRTANGARTLSLNTTLNQAAHNKLQDMLALQYFEHISPQGKGPADVVEAAAYEYLKVGENLALGNFASDAALVQAWMDSPGHRANILENGYTEIGVAVGQGTFEGRSVWLAVQTFGTPAAVCAAVDTNLKKSIETKQLTAEQLQQELINQDASIAEKFFAVEQLADAIKALITDGQNKIEQGNQKIAAGNRIYQETGSPEQAQPYWDAGKKLQGEGQALIDQAKDKQQSELPAAENALKSLQESYNEQVDEYNHLNQELVTLVAAYNNQVKTFNACLENYN